MATMIRERVSVTLYYTYILCLVSVHHSYLKPDYKHLQSFSSKNCRLLKLIFSLAVSKTLLGIL